LTLAVKAKYAFMVLAGLERKKTVSEVA